MHGLRLAWSYFPHAWSVKCGGAKYTPMDIYTSDEKFKSAIRKCWKLFNRVNDNTIRKILKIHTNSQAVSNFRPSAAKLIYEKFGGDVIWDMSCGWGGRLIGFLASSRPKYIGTEPSSKTFEGLKRIKKDFNYLTKSVELHKLGSEVFEPKKESLDLCFTSPPYFDTEKYSDEETQCMVRYRTLNEWFSGYVEPTIKNIYKGLNKDGIFATNIADYKTYGKKEYKVVDDWITLSERIGFRHVGTIKMMLNTRPGVGNNKLAGRGKFEGVYVFRK